MLILLLSSLSLSSALAGPASASPPNDGGGSECGEPRLGELVSYDISGCSSGVCPLVRGKDTEINVTFVPNVEVSRLRVALHGMVLGFPVPFHLTNDDACQGSGLACPLAAGKQHSFVSVVPIKMYYPPMAVTVKMQLSDPESGADVVCKFINTRIV